IASFTALEMSSEFLSFGRKSRMLYSTAGIVGSMSVLNSNGRSDGRSGIGSYPIVSLSVAPKSNQIFSGSKSSAGRYRYSKGWETGPNSIGVSNLVPVAEISYKKERAPLGYFAYASRGAVLSSGVNNLK